MAEACMLEAPGTAAALRHYAEAGGQLVLLPAEPGQQAALGSLLDRPVRVQPHEAYHLAAEYDYAAVQGFSPVDLFGFDKVFLSPRELGTMYWLRIAWTLPVRTHSAQASREQPGRTTSCMATRLNTAGWLWWS
ncbi:hypothetical protein NST84_23715 [Paenibacillus sp. FSL R7-0345]|uniref:hypothetical protein n=1 Tax=Paenibacillus sp. FSL R7-0345 TaxID=2954535 RepID=UPI00315AC4DD